MFFDPDPIIALHLARAITTYKNLHRRNGANRLPAELDQILEAMTARANEGQPGPTFDRRLETDKAEYMEKVVVTYAQAAQRLGCSERTVKRRAAAGAFPVVRDGQLARVRVTDLDAYLKSHTNNGATHAQ